MITRRTSRLTVTRILAWADAHHRRTGRWPNRFSGHVVGTVEEKWSAIEAALFGGSRGLAGRSTIPKLLAKHRGVRNRGNLSKLTVGQILKWADAHHQRTGRWPNERSGAVADASGEQWAAIHANLVHGHRGLPAGLSIARLLVEQRGVRSQGYAPRLTIDQILKWADAHHQRTGRWPDEDSGDIPNTRGETWNRVHWALYHGHRGLRGNRATRGLARLLQKHRAKRNRLDLPRLTHDKIIAWARRHHERTGRWPNRFSGNVTDSPGDTWTAIEIGLDQGTRGLPGGESLNKLLAKHCGKRDPLNPPRLSIPQILKWADHHYESTGTLPGILSGKVLATQGETWEHVNRCMRKGKRGLTAGPGIRELLIHKRPAVARRSRSMLTRDVLLEWIAAHHELTGSRPNVNSGAVIDEEGETWRAIDAALRTGSRGLKGGINLEAFIRGQYQPPYAGIGQKLTVEKVMQWARDFNKRVGRWPSIRAGYVFPAPRSAAQERKAGRSLEQDRPGERWSIIDRCLREGRRGVQRGSSLAKVVAAARKNDV